MTTVLLVEDDPTMSEMVGYNLAQNGLTVDTASEGMEGLRKARDPGVAVLVLDLMLPGLDGLQIAAEIRRTRPTLPILMLTARNEERTKLSGFAAGVDDYLTKPFSMDELVARVKALLRRARPSDVADDASEVGAGDLRLSPRELRCWVGGTELDLRPKEFALLSTLAGEPGKLFTRLELIQRVWGHSYTGDTRTIDTHMKNLRRKVEDASAYRYLETVRGVGYRFRAKPKSS